MLHVMNEMPSQVHLPTQITQHANEWNETVKGLRNQNGFPGALCTFKGLSDLVSRSWYVTLARTTPKESYTQAIPVNVPLTSSNVTGLVFWEVFSWTAMKILLTTTNNHEEVQVVLQNSFLCLNCIIFRKKYWTNNDW